MKRSATRVLIALVVGESVSSFEGAMIFAGHGCAVPHVQRSHSDRLDHHRVRARECCNDCNRCAAGRSVRSSTCIAHLPRACSRRLVDQCPLDAGLGCDPRQRCAGTGGTDSAAVLRTDPREPRRGSRSVRHRSDLGHGDFHRRHRLHARRCHCGQLFLAGCVLLQCGRRSHCRAGRRFQCAPFDFQPNLANRSISSAAFFSLRRSRRCCSPWAS